MAVVAAGAYAEVKLPDLSVTLLGGAYPLHSQGSLAKAATTLSGTTGNMVSGEGVTILFLSTELSALGTFTADFTKIALPEGKPCSSVGDAAGVILLSGEFHLVPIDLSPLTLGVLYLLSEFELTCEGGVIVLFRGNLLSTLNGIGSEATELAGFGGTLVAEKGKSEISEYYNDGGTKVKAKLEAEAGIGFVAAAQNIVGELGVSVLGSQMAVITNR
jgi:hypothetical protein